MKKFLLLAAAAVIAGAAGMWIGQHFRAHALIVTPVPRAAVAGNHAVTFSLPDLHGNDRSIQDWQGKVRIVNFWATWCPPCRQEIPEFIRAQKRYGHEGLQIIGVAVDRTSHVVAFYRARNMNYPVLLGEGAGPQLMAKYGDAEGGLPYSIILNRQGRIVASKLGAFTESELTQTPKPLLKSSP